MDNQPTPMPAPTNPQPTQPDQPTQPIPQPPAEPTPEQSAPEAPEQPVPIQPTQPSVNPGNFTNPATPINTATGDIIPSSVKKKKRRNLIIALVCLFIVLLGGGSFAAAYMITNQPENIVASSLNNLITADQVAVDGEINFSANNTGLEAFQETVGINSVTVSFNSQKVTSNNATRASISASFTDGSTTSPVNIGEVFLSNGILYLEADGIKDFYYNDVYDRARESLISQMNSSYQSQLYYNCYTTATDANEYRLCDSVYETELDPETKASLEPAINNILDQVGEIVSSLDGQWIELSIDDIMNSEMLASIAAPTRQAITTAYHCTIDKVSHFQNYSAELSDLYSQNSFVVIDPAQDSFYNISFDAAKLANFINATPKTKLANDIATCFDATIPADADLGATAENLQDILDYLPQISAKFDGFFDHRLAELKLDKQQDQYSVTADLKFSYPDDVTISTPTDSRPVMDVVEEVYQKFQSLEGYYSF